MTDKKRTSAMKALILLAVPSLIEQILETLMQYVDTAMVGHLGAEATAAVSTTTTISWLVGTLSWSLGAAFLALVARAHGAGEVQKVRKYAGFAFLTAVLSGIFISALSCGLSGVIPAWMKADEKIRPAASEYFFIISLPFVFKSVNWIMSAVIRAVKDTKTPMIINLGANVLNAGLNALLIYRFGMGVWGAALASCIASIVAGIAMFAAVMAKEELRFGRNDIKPDREMLVNVAKIGLPSMATGVASCMGYVVFARIVSGMGTTIFAAHSIALSAEELFYMPGYGLKTATASLIGNALGEDDEEKMRGTERAGLILNLAIMCVSALALFFFAREMMLIFTEDKAVVEAGAAVLRIVAFSEPFFGLMICFEGIFYGKGQTGRVFIIETFSMWAVRIVLTVLAVSCWHAGLREVWYCMICDNVFKAMALGATYILTRRCDKPASRKAPGN